MNKNFLLLTTITIGIFLLLALGTGIVYQTSSNSIKNIDSQMTALDKRLASNQAQISELTVDKQLLSNNIELTAEKQRQMIALLNQVSIEQAALANIPAPTVTTTPVVKPVTSTVRKTTTTTTKTTTTPVRRTSAS